MKICLILIPLLSCGIVTFNETDKNYLYRAILAGNKKKITSILKKYPDIIYSNVQLNISFFDAAIENGDLGLFKYIVHRCKKNRIRKKLTKALITAVTLDNWRIIKYLLHEIKCDVNNVNSVGDTPFHRVSSITSARILIRAGAEVNTRNQMGATPLHYVLRNGNKKLALFIIQHGADPTISDKFGITPLSLMDASMKRVVEKKMKKEVMK